MGATVDGRIIGEHWGGNLDKYGNLYEQCHDSFESQAWMVGRVTMEKDFTEGRQPVLQTSKKPIYRKSYIGDKRATSFAVTVDAKGKLGWDSNEIDGDHVIEILSESVSDGYLQYLQSINVSYIFAGKNDLDLKLALEQLHGLFGIKTLMLEGGGNINGSLLHAGIIDELSLLVLPIADGTPGTPTIFEIRKPLKGKTATALKLIGVEKLEYDVLWLRYKIGQTN